jgi:hypothetical protein
MPSIKENSTGIINNNEKGKIRVLGSKLQQEVCQPLLTQETYVPHPHPSEAIQMQDLSQIVRFEAISYGPLGNT